jgi:hypothetical protein
LIPTSKPSLRPFTMCFQLSNKSYLHSRDSTLFAIRGVLTCLGSGSGAAGMGTVAGPTADAASMIVCAAGVEGAG